MKVLYITHNLHSGGAANYAKRVISCQGGLVDRQEVYVGSLGNSELPEYLLGTAGNGAFKTFKADLANALDIGLRSLERAKQHKHRSLNLVGALSARAINSSSSDLVDLFWIGHGLISLRQLEKIEKPLVWHCLDMWPFTTSEHYVHEDEDRVFDKDGVKFRNRYFSVFNLDTKVYKRKSRLRRKQITYIHPSKWLEKVALNSELTSDAKHFVIPPPIDLEFFQFRPPRRNVGNTRDSFAIGFGGGLSGRKGWHEAKSLFLRLQAIRGDFRFVHFGCNSPDQQLAVFPNYEFRGSFDVGDESLVTLLNDLELLLFPSLFDAYGLLGQEAQACGAAIAVRKDTGAESIIEEGVSGFSFVNSDDLLAKVISFIDKPKSEMLEIRQQARLRAEKYWSYEKIAELTLDVYEQALR